MFERDDRPSQWPESREPESLETTIAQLSNRIREVTQLVRAIAPVIGELQALREAAALLTPLDPAALEGIDGEPAAPASARGAGARAADLASPQLPTPLSARAEAPDPGTAARADQRQVRVTIARLNGPLEPVRIRRGLATLAGVRDVALVQRDASRLTVALDTDQAPERLPIAEALAMVFDQEIQGEWTGEREYLAVVEGSPEGEGET